MSTTTERLKYLDKINSSLKKEKDETYRYWSYLSKNTDSKRILQDSSRKILLKSVHKHEDHILNVLQMCNEPLVYKNNLESFKDLMSSLDRSELYELYLQNHKPKHLKPGMIEDFLQRHKKMNQTLKIIKKLCSKKGHDDI